MHRLLHVTTDYLKFTFGMMLVATAVFSLAGLALTRPSIFVGVMAAIAIIGFAVFVEVGDHRRVRELSRKNKANPKAESEALAEIFDFGRGLATAYAPILYFAAHADARASQDLPVRALLISQWNLNPSYAAWNPKAKDYEAEVIMQYFSTRREELDQLGVCPYFVSKAPSQEIVRMMHEGGTLKRWGGVAESQIIAAYHGSQKEKTISIGFLSANAHVLPESLMALLADKFDLVRVDVLDVTKSES